MKNILIKSLAICLLGSLGMNSHAGEHVFIKPFASDTFATLPEDVRYPEGITSNPDNGDIYVATFNVPNAEYNPNPMNSILRYSKSGNLISRTNISGPTPLVGIRFNVEDQHIYVASLGDITGVGSKILKLDANFTDQTQMTVVSDIPFLGAPYDRIVENIDGSAHNLSFNTFIRVPNDIIFDKQGGMYVSDSFQGAVFYLPNAANCASHCELETLVHDGLLATPGFPSFGANGLALNASEDRLYIANTGDDRVIKFDLETESLSIFAEGVNGADGLAFDRNGFLWATANQADHIVALDSNGRVAAQLGSNNGLRYDGTPKGLLFPASLEIIGNKILVTNMAQVATPMIGDELEEKVTRFTVSQVDIPLFMRLAFP